MKLEDKIQYLKTQLKILNIVNIKKEINILKEKWEDKVSEIRDDLILDRDSLNLNCDLNEINANVQKDYDQFLKISSLKWELEYTFKKLTSAVIRVKITDMKDHNILPFLINEFLKKYNLGFITNYSKEIIFPKENKEFCLNILIDFNKNITSYDIDNALSNEITIRTLHK